MTVVEAATGKFAVAVDDFNDAAGFRLRFGALHHLLENPGMVGAPFNLELDDGQCAGRVLVHP